MKKEHIIKEIKRTAEDNAGIPLGMGKFKGATGIKKADWYGIYWTKWSDAVSEAGYKPNRFSIPAYDKEWLLKQLALFIREIGSFPTEPEFKIKHYRDKNFPTVGTFKNRLGSKKERIKSVIEFCEKNNKFSDVKKICFSSIDSIEEKPDNGIQGQDEEFGYVYLMKSGKFYKVGRSNSVGRRIYDLRIQLPEKPKLIHKIKTDDPSGIEAYWHSRFTNKRKGGEWFELSNQDIKAFKRRKFM